MGAVLEMCSEFPLLLNNVPVNFERSAYIPFFNIIHYNDKCSHAHALHTLHDKVENCDPKRFFNIFSLFFFNENSCQGTN